MVDSPYVQVRLLPQLVTIDAIVGEPDLDGVRGGVEERDLHRAVPGCVDLEVHKVVRVTGGATDNLGREPTIGGSRLQVGVARVKVAAGGRTSNRRAVGT